SSTGNVQTPPTLKSNLQWRVTYGRVRRQRLSYNKDRRRRVVAGIADQFSKLTRWRFSLRVRSQRLASGFESDLTVTVSTAFLFSRTGPFEPIPQSQLLFQD